VVAVDTPLVAEPAHLSHVELVVELPTSAEVAGLAVPAEVVVDHCNEPTKEFFVN